MRGAGTRVACEFPGPDWYDDGIRPLAGGHQQSHPGAAIFNRRRGLGGGAG